MPTNNNDLIVTEKICSHCGKSKPIDEFRRRNRNTGDRHSECRQCVAAYQRQQTAAKRSTELRAYVEKVARDVTSPEAYGATSRIQAVTNAMLTRFGGLDAFSDYWFRFIGAARAAGKDHLVQRSFECLLRFLELTDRHVTASQNSMAEMSNDELQREIHLMLVRELWQSPELAVVALEARGYQVIAPELEDVDVASDGYRDYRERMEPLVAERF